MINLEGQYLASDFSPTGASWDGSSGDLTSGLDMAWEGSPYNNNTNGMYSLPGTMGAEGSYDPEDPYNEKSRSLYDMFRTQGQQAAGEQATYSNEGNNYSGPSGINAATGSPTNTGVPSITDNLSNWMSSKWGKGAMTALGFAVPGMGPALLAGNVANQAYRNGPEGLATTGANILGSQGLTGMFGLAGALPGMFGYGMGNTAAGLSGSNNVGSNYGNQTPVNAPNNMLTGLGGLAALYGQYSAGNTASKYTNSLSSIYGQNSPYAQQLRQTLQRQAAANGQRSNTGAREVELQAKLAEQATRLAPSIQQGYQNDLQNKMRLAQQAAALYKSGAFDGLGRMFQSAPSGSYDFSSLPSYGGNMSPSGSEGNLDLGGMF